MQSVDRVEKQFDCVFKREQICTYMQAHIALTIVDLRDLITLKSAIL